MPRPPSIKRFEQLYLASLVLWILEKLAFWPNTRAIAATNPAFAANPRLAGMVAPLVIVTTLVVAGAALLFWWLVARRGSAVGKWLVVVTEALGAVSLLGALLRAATGRIAGGLDLALGAAVTLLAIAAAFMLFRPDANRWFREAGAAETLR